MSVSLPDKNPFGLPISHRAVIHAIKAKKAEKVLGAL